MATNSISFFQSNFIHQLTFVRERIRLFNCGRRHVIDGVIGLWLRHFDNLCDQVAALSLADRVVVCPTIRKTLLMKKPSLAALFRELQPEEFAYEAVSNLHHFLLLHHTNGQHERSSVHQALLLACADHFQIEVNELQERLWNDFQEGKDDPITLAVLDLNRRQLAIVINDCELLASLMVSDNAFDFRDIQLAAIFQNRAALSLFERLGGDVSSATGFKKTINDILHADERARLQYLVLWTIEGNNSEFLKDLRSHEIPVSKLKPLTLDALQSCCATHFNVSEDKVRDRLWQDFHEGNHENLELLGQKFSRCQIAILLNDLPLLLLITLTNKKIDIDDLHVAAIFRNLGALVFFKKMGADFTARTSFGATSYDLLQAPNEYRIKLFDLWSKRAVETSVSDLEAHNTELFQEYRAKGLSCCKVSILDSQLCTTEDVKPGEILSELTTDFAKAICHGPPICYILEVIVGGLPKQLLIAATTIKRGDCITLNFGRGACSEVFCDDIVEQFVEDTSNFTFFLSDVKAPASLLIKHFRSETCTFEDSIKQDKPENFGYLKMRTFFMRMMLSYLFEFPEILQELIEKEKLCAGNAAAFYYACADFGLMPFSKIGTYVASILQVCNNLPYTLTFYAFRSRKDDSRLSSEEVGSLLGHLNHIVEIFRPSVTYKSHPELFFIMERIISLTLIDKKFARESLAHFVGSLDPDYNFLSILCFKVLNEDSTNHLKKLIEAYLETSHSTKMATLTKSLKGYINKKTCWRAFVCALRLHDLYYSTCIDRQMGSLISTLEYYAINAADFFSAHVECRVPQYSATYLKWLAHFFDIDASTSIDEIRIFFTQMIYKELLQDKLDPIQLTQNMHISKSSLSALLGENALLITLIAVQAKINERDAAGYTTAHFAAMFGNWNALVWLHMLGARLDIQSESGATALTILQAQWPKVTSCTSDENIYMPGTFFVLWSERAKSTDIATLSAVEKSVFAQWQAQVFPLIEIRNGAVYARVCISEGTFLGEFIGNVIPDVKQPATQTMRLTPYQLRIDAAKLSNYTALIDPHSENVGQFTVLVDGLIHLLLYAKRAIQPGKLL